MRIIVTRYLSTTRVLVAWLALTACTSLLERDFQKATLVSEVELGNSSVYTRTFTPPIGAAKLILAVPNYRCSTPADGAISLTVRADGKNLFSERKRLSDLAWSRGEGSCDAYGYVAGGGTIEIKDAQIPITFEIDVSGIKSEIRPRASVWLVYGDRVPTARIFGERK
jgi:hypothetical protein